MLTPGVRSDESSEIKERYSSPRNPARFQLISKSNSQGSGALLSSDAPHP
jgi:hypothetical protein